MSTSPPPPRFPGLISVSVSVPPSCSSSSSCRTRNGSVYATLIRVVVHLTAFPFVGVSLSKVVDSLSLPSLLTDCSAFSFLCMVSAFGPDKRTEPTEHNHNTASDYVQFGKGPRTGSAQVARGGLAIGQSSAEEKGNPPIGNCVAVYD